MEATKKNLKRQLSATEKREYELAKGIDASVMVFVNSNVQASKAMLDKADEQVGAYLILLPWLEQERESLKATLSKLEKAKERAIKENDILESHLCQFVVAFRSHIRLKGLVEGTG